MDSLRLLNKQPRTVESLFDRSERLGPKVAQEPGKSLGKRTGKGTRAKVRRLAETRANPIPTGDTIFVPLADIEACADGRATQLHTAVEQPRDTRQLVGEILRRIPPPARFEARMRAIHERVWQQLDLEEGADVKAPVPASDEDLFPPAEKHLSPEERATLSAQMNRLFERLLTPEPGPRPILRTESASVAPRSCPESVAR